ncbi:MAG: hypothetical protein PHI81_04250 [Synergistaceae bacterium]|jgi:hypothetical protein|uniref:hypothetical protein n=1 Tax=Aminivibrio sp. TaxID=1872489 RepID=UPI00345EF6CE|nr:hypothetical protein [Synergistaceae bacterium]MDD3689234.1 hypothetical protein [Synergistaceae bacterium]MDD4613657.1 hypothetical protein [Synergistaceae bacterium]
MTDLTVRTNTGYAQNDGFFGFAFTGGLWLYYYAAGLVFRRDPSSASSYPALPGAA